MTEELPKQDFIKKCFGFLRLLHFSLTPPVSALAPHSGGPTLKLGGRGQFKIFFLGPSSFKKLVPPLQ